MSAQPIGTHAHAPWRPDPVRQEAADYTLEDVLNLPRDTPRVELSHGVMLTVPSPTAIHQNISRQLCNWLDTQAPEQYAAAGIPFYWRIEQNPVHVYAYRLAPKDTYELAADSAEVLELEEPFPIKLVVADLARRRRPSPATGSARPDDHE